MPWAHTSSWWDVSPGCQPKLYLFHFPGGQVAACTRSWLSSLYLCCLCLLHSLQVPFQVSFSHLLIFFLSLFCCMRVILWLQQNWRVTHGHSGFWWEKSKKWENFPSCLHPRYIATFYLIHRSLYSRFLCGITASLISSPLLKNLLGMMALALPGDNRSVELRCVNSHPVGDKNTSWCAFTVHQFKHQLCSYFLLNVDKSPCIKPNLRFIRQDLKQEKHLSRNWTKILLMMCYWIWRQSNGCKTCYCKSMLRTKLLTTFLLCWFSSSMGT